MGAKRSVKRLRSWHTGPVRDISDEGIEAAEEFLNSEPVRDWVAVTLMDGVASGEAFYCRLCESYVDSRFTLAHLRSHPPD